MHNNYYNQNSGTRVCVVIKTHTYTHRNKGNGIRNERKIKKTWEKKKNKKTKLLGCAQLNQHNNADRLTHCYWLGVNNFLDGR